MALYLPWTVDLQVVDDEQTDVNLHEDGRRM
jgi:hypothetical protein